MCDCSQLCYICGLLEVNGCVQRPSIRPHVLISSLPVDTPGPVGDQNERESDTDEEGGSATHSREEEKGSGRRAAQRGYAASKGGRGEPGADGLTPPPLWDV